MQKKGHKSQSKTIHDGKSPRWRAEFFAPVFKETIQSLPEVIGIHSRNRRTRILATMLPDELIRTVNFKNKQPNKFIGIVLLADVTGMTMLHEMYRYSGHGGSIDFNTTLNAYFGYIVQAVYSYGGDVFKITGNGLLAIWKVRDDQLIFNLLHEVITCGLRIQEAVGRFITSVNVTLKLKLTISAGNLTFVVIGEENCYNYLVTGSPIEEAKLAKNVCLPGDLVLAGSAWGNCNPSCYEYIIKDTYNVKIQRIITDIRQPTRRKIAVRESVGTAKRKMFNVKERTSVYWGRIDPYREVIVAARPTINEAVVQQIGKQLKTFIIQSAVRLIDNEQPLQYLTELRRVTTMFIKIIPLNISVDELIRLADDTFVLVSNTIHDHGGHIIRVYLFQKELSFLMVFGLQDIMNDSASENALLSGLKIQNLLKNFYGVCKVSVGITTGLAHCGIVGHNLRQEYVVIGSTLQKAIDLEAVGVDKVICDLTTLLRSNLPRKRFILQESKVLKGVRLNSFYEYTDDTFNGEVSNVELTLHYPILDRYAELDILNLTLDDIGLANRDHSGILVKGETGSGKSRLLDGFITLIRSREIATITITLTPDYAIAPYSVIYSILTEMFDIDEHCSIEIREQKMVKNLGEVIPSEDLCYLNEILKVKFPVSKKCSTKTELERQTQTIKLLKDIFLLSNVRRCILIDDIHNIDQISWQVLSRILNVKCMVLIASIEIPLDDQISKSISEIYLDKRMAHLTLGRINFQCVTALACQILNVQAIPQLLEKELLSKTHHNPSYCQALLTAALGYGGLQRVEISPKKAMEYGLILSPVNMLTKIPLDSLPEDIAPALPWERRLKIHACLIGSLDQFQFSCRSKKINDMLLITYNKLSTYEQGLIKGAAILGVIFTRQMLQIMTPNFSNFHTTKAITNMFNLRIFYCASLVLPNFSETETLKFCVSKKRNTFTDSQHLLYCNCSDPQIGDTYSQRLSTTPNDDLSHYSRCKFLAFKMPRFRQFIYDLIPDYEKKELHSKAMDIYKIEAHKCKACGGGNFLELPTRHKMNKSVVLSQSGQKNLMTVKKTSFDSSSRRKSSQNKLNSYYSSNNVIAGKVMNNYQRGDEESKNRKESAGSFDGRRRVSILPFYLETNDQMIASSESLSEPEIDIEDEQEVRGGKFCDWIKSRLSKSVYKLSELDPDTKSLRVPRLTQFRGVDLRNCQCSLVLNNIYKRLLYHSKNFGNTGNHIFYLIDYSAGLIRIAEYLHAIKILARADELNKVYESFKDDQEKSIVKRMATKGVILSLISEIYFQLGYHEKARRFTVDEMAIYGCVISTSKLLLCHHVIANEDRQLIHQLISGLSMSKLSEKDALEKSKISDCIARLSSIFMTNGQPKLAKLTVLVSLNIAKTCKDQPITILSSYKLAMLYYRQIGDMKFCQRLEKSALKIIAEQFPWNDLQAVLILADVFESIFYSKLIRGELQNAIDYGFKALKIAGNFHLVKFRLEILPILIQAVIQAKRIPEAVDLLRELAYLAREDFDMSGTIWYHALCIDLLLDAGVSVESVETCQEFAQKLLDMNNYKTTVRDATCSIRLITNMWLLLTRMGNDSPKYELPCEVYLDGIKNESYSHLWTVLKAVEGRMLKITYYLNYKKGNALSDSQRDVTELLDRLTRVSKISKFVKPRLYLLKGYMSVIRGQIRRAKKAVIIAEKLSYQQEASLMQVSVELHKKTWLNNYPTTNNRWIGIVSQEEKINWHDVHDLPNDDYMKLLYCLLKPGYYL